MTSLPPPLAPATQIGPRLYVLDGAVHTGVLTSGTKALLIDCCDSVSVDVLARLGLTSVERILCTQHRRPNVSGARPYVERDTMLTVPACERHLFEDVDAYWSDPANRWHIYHHQPGPQVLARSLPVDHAVQDGDVIEWEGFSIRVLDTPGATDGSVSYLVQDGDRRVCFSGDAIYGSGQLLDLHSLQKGMGDILDYHGFLGNKRKLMPSLSKLASCGADLLVPSHGRIINDPAGAIGLLLDRLDPLWRNYTSISSLNHYFPDFFAETRNDPHRMTPAATREPPPYVRRVAFTSFALISETGAAFLIDCGDRSVVEALQEWVRDGQISAVEGCWVTHYHDDHVDALEAVRSTFGCPVIADACLAEIVEHPERFFLPCISPYAATVDRMTRDGETWRWREFAMTGFQFPGQSYHHGGLLVEGMTGRVFFAGDSGSPTGIDDHCPGNRNLLGSGRGFRRCIGLWREVQPDWILNQHQDLAFAFSDAQLDHMDGVLADREALLSDLLPWPNPNFGTDENWARAYPYEQEAQTDTLFWVDVQFTNHGLDPATAHVTPALPDGWLWDADRSISTVTVQGQTCGTVNPGCGNRDGTSRIWIAPEGAEPGRYVIPFRVAWNGRYLGQFRHAIVTVTE